MDLEFSDDQQELRHSVRAFLDRECPPALVRRVAETGEPAHGLWRSMVALDWPALAVPADCGGLGLGFVELAVVAEELGASIAPVPYLPTTTQFATALSVAGTPDQRQRFLCPLAAGDLVGALAVCDHPNRWLSEDAAAATAEPSAAGFVLSGRKQMVMAAPDVDEVVVVACINGPDTSAPTASARASTAPRLFVVSGHDVDIRPVRALDASRPLSTVVLDRVEVPADRLLGALEDPAATATLERVLEEASVALALEVVGTCRTLLDLTVAYAKDRQQFGVPIGSFQAVKHKLADCFVSLQRARALGYFAVAAIAEVSPERSMAASMAKAAADDCQRKVCQEAIQTLGGIGFTWEHDAHLFVKRARSSAMLFGAAPEHRRKIARLLGVGRSIW